MGIEQEKSKMNQNEFNILKLKDNLQSSRKNYKDFHFKTKVCRECSFETESDLILEHHMEKIHKTLGCEIRQDLLNLVNLDSYRCDICYYQTKNPSEIMKHIQEEIAKLEEKLKKDRSQLAVPKFLFDPWLKGKLRRSELEN